METGEACGFLSAADKKSVRLELARAAGSHFGPILGNDRQGEIPRLARETAAGLLSGAAPVFNQSGLYCWADGLDSWLRTHTILLIAESRPDAESVLGILVHRGLWDDYNTLLDIIGSDSAVLARFFRLVGTDTVMSVLRVAYNKHVLSHSRCEFGCASGSASFHRRECCAEGICSHHIATETRLRTLVVAIAAIRGTLSPAHLVYCLECLMSGPISYPSEQLSACSFRLRRLLLELVEVLFSSTSVAQAVASSDASGGVSLEIQSAEILDLTKQYLAGRLVYQSLPRPCPAHLRWEAGLFRRALRSGRKQFSPYPCDVRRLGAYMYPFSVVVACFKNSSCWDRSPAVARSVLVKAVGDLLRCPTGGDAYFVSLFDMLRVNLNLHPELPDSDPRALNLQASASCLLPILSLRISLSKPFCPSPNSQTLHQRSLKCTYFTAQWSLVADRAGLITPQMLANNNVSRRELDWFWREVLAHPVRVDDLSVNNLLLCRRW